MMLSKDKIIDKMKQPNSVASLFIIFATIVLLVASLESSAVNDDYDFTISSGIAYLNPFYYYFIVVVVILSLFYSETQLNGLKKYKLLSLASFGMSLILLKEYPHDPVPTLAALQDKNLRINYFNSQKSHHAVAALTFASLLSYLYLDDTETIISKSIKGIVLGLLSAALAVSIYFFYLKGDVSAQDIVLNVKLLALLEYVIVILFVIQLFFQQLNI